VSDELNTSVLLADDDEAVRRLLRSVLEGSGLKVLEAGNGTEALALARTSEFGIAIVDLVMPDKDGLETIRELRRLQPAVRIIAISGADYLKIASRLGADAILAKPIHAGDLTACVSKLLGWPG
jgi:two-component system, chemotaxis family, chemotaxis protein CheY